MKKTDTTAKVLDKINSKRQFCMVLSDSMPSGSLVTYTLQEIMYFSFIEDYEWAHSLMDILDSVLDLKINEATTFYPNRDDDNLRSGLRTIAIIKRIR